MTSYVAPKTSRPCLSGSEQRPACAAQSSGPCIPHSSGLDACQGSPRAELTLQDSSTLLGQFKRTVFLIDVAVELALQVLHGENHALLA